MGKFYKYKRDSKEYDEILNFFLNEFEKEFGKIYDRNKLYNELRKNIKVIKKLKSNEPNFRVATKGYARGCYDPIFKKLLIVSEKDKVANHEILHALSRNIWMKRINLIDSFSKKRNDTGLSEGITEHLASEMSDDLVVKNSSSEYKLQASTIKYLSRIYGNKMILDYYLGINDDLVENINKHDKDNFDNIRYVLRRFQFVFHGEKPCNFSNKPFESISYDDKGKKKEFNILFDLFCKEKLIAVNTIDDFIHNAKEIFNYYKTDIINSCYEFKRFISEDEKQNKYFKEMFASEFEKLDKTLRLEWNKLGIYDELLYNKLVIEQIKALHVPKSPKLVPLIIDNTNFYKRYKKLLDEGKTDNNEDIYLTFLQSLNKDQNKISYFDELHATKKQEKNNS